MSGSQQMMKTPTTITIIFIICGIINSGIKRLVLCKLNTQIIYEYVYNFAVYEVRYETYKIVIY